MSIAYEKIFNSTVDHAAITGRIGERSGLRTIYGVLGVYDSTYLAWKFSLGMGDEIFLSRKIME